MIYLPPTALTTLVITHKHRISNDRAVHFLRLSYSDQRKTLSPLTKVPFGIFYGQLKHDPLLDPRFEKLLTELAPKG